MVAEPPEGWRRLRWLGPGFLWMTSAAGSGELLFTPRIGAMYGYSLLWAMLAAVCLKWVINREIGRFAVCTGSNLIQGLSRLPRGGKWAVGIIVAPQLVVAVSAIAGMAGSAATALILVLPGGPRLWMICALLLSAVLVFIGRYALIERFAVIIGSALGIAAVAAALSVGPSTSDLLAGFKPRLTSDIDYGEVLPWLGFMLSGAAGMVWYSFWVPAKGYGAGGAAGQAASQTEAEITSPEDVHRLRGWLRQMTLDNTVAVFGAFIIAGAFLILGAELLQPKGLVPEENKVASTLGRLLGDVWGPVGYWFMIAAVFIGFWDTVLSDQDGHARVFTTGSALLVTRMRRIAEGTRRRAFLIVVLTLMPIALYLAVGEPVALLKFAGAIEAVHIPVVALLTLRLNSRFVPESLRPSRFTVGAVIIAALFFTAFAGYYLWTLF